ncbi:hypothetical protein GTZ99_12385 [Novosphingobium sp. FSY-8]|uniref:Uncharacterized protein n=1 Tax=Novosphingobium ovatum TaxID=1908523 RepID=A0ABW9XFL9_9SPHN|nr:hypothetical protein [Novosphingobium ovatum]NBC37348.1 hypothetical protein [Novosphingobium ovatum]
MNDAEARANLTCLRAMADYALANGPGSLARLDPDAIAAKHRACPFLIRLVVGMICPANAECAVA